MKRHKKIILTLADNDDEVVTLEIHMSKVIADIIRQIRKYKEVPAHFPKNWDCVFVEVFTNALQEEILKFAKEKFRGNTNIRSEMVN